MRVALVVPVFPQPSETFIVNKAIGLLDRGIDVRIVCSSSPEATWSGYGSDHRVHEMRARVEVSPSAALHPDAVLGSLRQVAGLARAPRGSLKRYLAHDGGPTVRRVRDLVIDAPLVSIEPDLVHFEFGSLAPGRMALRHRLPCAVAVSFRGYDLNHVALDDPDHYRDLWENADGIHVLGDALWRSALHRGAPPETPHTVITPAIDTSSITATPTRPGELGVPHKPLRLLSIGRLHWTKGYEYALDAVAALRDAGLKVTYRIVGDGELLAAVAFWRHQLDLTDSVELLRAVPPAEVVRQLEWADIVLHAATTEGFCNAVIEAQASGVPVVCADSGGLPENVEHGVTGIVVPRRDPRALADAVIDLAADGDKRARMGAAGRERVERLFRLDDQIDAWVDFYERAVDRRRQPAGRSAATG